MSQKDDLVEGDHKIAGTGGGVFVLLFCDGVFAGLAAVHREMLARLFV